MMRAIPPMRLIRYGLVFLCLGLNGSWGGTEPGRKASSQGGMNGVEYEWSVPLSASPEMDCIRITTPSAVYYFEKVGAGLAAMMDPDGVDWIGFRPEPGTGSGGEFRGFPNAVHRQAGSYFHALNQGTDPSTLRLERKGPDHIAIYVISDNRLWACRYDFYPTHCSFTMTAVPEGYGYWVLYEGTPGGILEKTDWWITSGTLEPQPASVAFTGDIPGPEWIAFGDPEQDRVVYVLNHEDDDKVDAYYPMNWEMTVFGFGRNRLEKHLTTPGPSFSLGFIESSDPHEIAGILNEKAKNE